MSTQPTTQLKRHLAGATVIAIVVGLLTLALAISNRAFSDPLELTLRTDRAGLVMDVGNKVKLRGIEIGRVADIRQTSGGAELVLELDRDMQDSIPENVDAEIRSTTIFGAKYVELTIPDGAGQARIADGAVVDARGVTTEVNTVFKSLRNVLTGIDVSSLNQTLTVLARALDGRGEDIATLAHRADSYLSVLQPSLPQLRRDLVEVARLAELGLEISPQLFKILDNAAFTGSTIVDEQDALNRLLVDLTLLGDQGARLLGISEEALVGMVRSLRPTTGLLAAYSSELPCFLKGIDNARKLMEKAIGGTSPGFRVLAPLSLPFKPYTYPDALPGLPTREGPDCRGLPVVPRSQIPVPDVETSR